jgi:DnaK suppressor protein
MFVSILQLMGFPVGKPVHSRAKPAAHGQPTKLASEGISSKATENLTFASAGAAQALTNSVRRQEMKAQPGSGKVLAKAVKSAVKSKAKPVARLKDGKAKPPVGIKAGKAIQRTEITQVSKTGKVAKTSAVKVAKPGVNVKSKESVKTTIAKAAKPQAAAKKPKATPAVAAPKIVSPAPVTSMAPTIPVRAGRPSSRLAHLTVPSMAQSVASTAAKASFTQTPSSPLIVPPLAAAVKKDPKLANNWKLKSVEQLTDIEVVAMPDDEYMNETQMTFFRRKLVQLKKDILSNAGETTEHLREDTVVVPDPADRATIEEEHALELRTRDRERKLLKKIEQSIQRIDSGDYGYCDETGEPIGVSRLLARPTANLSLEAQQRRELKQKMFGD